MVVSLLLMLLFSSYYYFLYSFCSRDSPELLLLHHHMPDCRERHVQCCYFPLKASCDYKRTYFAPGTELYFIIIICIIIINYMTVGNQNLFRNVHCFMNVDSI